MAFGGLKKWFKDRASNVSSVASRAYDQANVFDGGKSWNTRETAGEKGIRIANERLQQQPARYGVLANQQNRNAFTQSQQQGNSFSPIAALPGAVGNATVKVLGKPFWETADIGRAAVMRDQANFRQSLNDSIIGGVGRFGQSVASAGLSPLTNRYADQERERAERLLTPAYENLYKAYGSDPRLGANQAQIEAGQTDYSLRTDPLNRSNVGVNDSLGTTTRKVGFQAAEAGLDILSAPAMALATKSAAKSAVKNATKSASKEFVKDTTKSGLLGAAGNVSYVGQQDGVTKGDIAKAGVTGFALGTALPVATRAAGQQFAKIANKQLSSELLQKRNYWVNVLADARAKGKNGTAKRAIQEIDKIDATTKRFRIKPLDERGFIAGPLAGDFSEFKKQGKVFEGVDGKPRFEVDDSGAKLITKQANQQTTKIPQEITQQKQALRDEMIKVADTGDMAQVKAVQAKLKELDTKYPEGSKTNKTYAKDVLDHQKLYEQYPELRTVEIVKKKLNGKNGYATQNSAGQPVIVLDTVTLNNDPEYAKGILLHELQHVIQNKERFASGSSDTNYDNYFKSAGEAEARAVASRMNMTPEQLAKTPFYDSLDVPKKDLIIRDGQGQSMSAKLPGDPQQPPRNSRQGRQGVPSSPAKQSGGRVRIQSGQSPLKTTILETSSQSPRSASALAEQGIGVQNRPVRILDNPYTDNTLRGIGGNEPPRIRIGEIDGGNSGASGGKTSKFAKTIQRSNEISPELKAVAKDQVPTYTPGVNKTQIELSDKYVKKYGMKNGTIDIKERLAGKRIDAQTVSDAIAVAKKLDQTGIKGNLQAATEIYEQLGKKLSEAGQTVQAASLLSNRTPEGLKYGAINVLKKNGVELGHIEIKKLDDLVNAVRQTQPQTYEGGLARHKLSEFVSRQIPHSNVSKGLQIWKAGLLSAPRTTAGNLFANSAETVFKKGYVDPVANAFDGIFSIFTGKRSRALTGRGMVSGAGEGAVKGVQYFKTGYDPRNPAQKFDVRNIHFSDTPAGKVAETYTQGIFRLMGAQDQPFYYANMRNSLYDQAITSAKNRGLRGAQKEAFVKKFITEPSREALQLADKEGRYAVFQNETALGQAASRLKGADGAVGNVAEFVMPFSGVPSSIATRIIERTPVGTATEIVKQIKKGKFDQRAMTQAIANGTAVLPLIAVGSALANSGQMTLGYPTDKNERELWEAEGKQPYSIRVGDKWYSLNYFQPGGTLIAAGAEYRNAINEGKDATEALATASAGAGKALTEQSFLKGVSGGLNAISDPVYAGQKFVDQTVGSGTPNIIRSFASATDPNQRAVDSPLDIVKSTIPGVRQTLDVKKDMFGRDVERRTGVVNSLLNPLKPSDVKNADDFAIQELRRLQNVEEGITPSQVRNSSFIKNGLGTKITDKQVRDLNAEIGRRIEPEWRRIMQDPRYNSMTDEQKRKVLEKVNDTISSVVKREFESSNQIGRYAADYQGKDSGLSAVEQRYAQGDKVDYFTKISGAAKNNMEAYKDALADYTANKSSMSAVDRYKTEDKLRSLEVKSKFENDVTDLYGLSKDKIVSFLENSQDGQNYLDQLLAYGDAMVEAGIYKYNKLRDKYGNISLAKSSSKSGRKGSRGGKGGGVSGNIKLATGKSPKVIAKVAKTSAPSVKLNTGSVRIAKRKVQTKIKTPKIKGANIA